MCNLFSVTKGQQAIRELYRVAVDIAGNLPPLPSVFPDQMAPVVRTVAHGRELAMLRWGFPSPPNVPGNRAVTNIRNTGSSYWREWLKPEWRCLVPVTAFCEYAAGKPAVPHWFALGEDRPLFAFAGLWRPWTGTRGAKADPVEGEHQLFAFLTCKPNAVVAPIHPKAMPVVLTTPEECDAWMTAPIGEALELQRSLADGLLSGSPHLVRGGARGQAGSTGGVCRGTVGAVRLIQTPRRPIRNWCGLCRPVSRHRFTPALAASEWVEVTA